MCSFRDNDSTLLVPWTETDAIICSLIVAATQARLQVTLAGGDQARICEHREKPVVLYLTCPSSSSEGPGHWAPGGSKWCLCQEYSTRILLRTCGRNFTQCISTGLHKRRLEPFTLHRGSSYIAWKACQAKRQRRPKGRRELHSAILLPVKKQFFGYKELAPFGSQDVASVAPKKAQPQQGPNSYAVFSDCQTFTWHQQMDLTCQGQTRSGSEAWTGAKPIWANPLSPTQLVLNLGRFWRQWASWTEKRQQRLLEVLHV